ncbi:MAG: PIN domain protein [Acidobacteria bacterium]|nr:PIN domain protein [Acidobacteriota bacterium]
MKRLRIYVDTSVLGGCFDPEFAEWSNRLVQRFREGEFAPLLSAVTAAEVEQAPEAVRQVHDELVRMGSEVLLASGEAMELLAAYEDRRILGPKFRNDMLHIAVATVAEADVLVSWNFRHIVRLDRIRLFNSVNLELGYKPLAIYSPREVVPHETDD